MALPNESFINYLKNYGPLIGSSNQQAENNKISKKANKGIEPLNFVIAGQNEYCAQLKQLIESKTSQIIFISGQAGDGKTHFLRNIFIDPNLLAQSEAIWDRDSQDIVFTCSCDDITFTIVKDFTEIASDNQRALDKVFTPIKSILAKNSPNCQIVLIAANNGKILEQFSKRASVDPELDEEIVRALEKFLLLSQDEAKLKNYAISCFNIAKCIDKSVICSVFEHIINREEWDNCKACTHCQACPILRNRNWLKNNPVFYQRLEQMFELLIDDGAHFTIRNIILLAVNTLLGRNDKQKQNRVYTCIRFNNLVAKQAAWETNDTSPFDNLFGSSFTMRNKSEDDPLYIFMQLEHLAIGQSTTKLIDNFLLFGHDDEFLGLSHNYQQLIDQQSQGKGFDYSSKLKELLNEIHDYEGHLASTDDDDDKNVEELKALHTLLLSLRRMLFFTMDYDGAKGLFNPYQLTAYPYAQDYLYLKHQLKECADHMLPSDDLIKRMMVGLNRAFTNLMALNKDNDLVVSTNNMLNPTAFCVLYDKDKYQLSYQTGDDPLVNRIKIVDGSLVKDVPEQMCLAFYGGIDKDSKSISEQMNQLDEEIQNIFSDESLSSDEQLYKFKSLTKQKEELKQQQAEGATGQGKLVTYIKLTPKLFDYLMSLSSGLMPLSFSDECFKEVIAFKSTLEDYISRNQQLGAAVEAKDMDISKLLKSIRFCSIDNQGLIS